MNRRTKTNDLAREAVNCNAMLGRFGYHLKGTAHIKGYQIQHFCLITAQIDRLVLPRMVLRVALAMRVLK